MELKDIQAVLDEHEYPATSDQLVAAHGDEVLHLPNGTETVGEVFGRFESETYDDASEALAMFYSGLSSKAIGRKGYSDRDSTYLGINEPQRVSF